MKKVLFLIFVFSCLFQSSQAQENSFQTGHTHDINEVKWSPDDTKILSHSAGDGSLRLWDAATGRLLWMTNIDVIKINKKLATLITFDWSPDQKLIASGSYNGTVQIWNTETGKPLHIIDAHPDDVTHVRFTPDGKQLISSSNSYEFSSEIKIWNVADGTLVKKLKGKPCSTIASAFEENGKILKTGNLDGSVLKWDLETGKLLNPQNSKCGVVRITDGKVGFSSDLKLKAQKEGKSVALYETEGDKRIKEFPSDESTYITILFSRNDRFLSFTGYDIKVFDLESGENFKFDEVNSGFTVDISGDGRFYAQGGGFGDASIKVSEIRTGKSYFIDGHPGIIGDIAYSLDGKYLAVGGSDKAIYIFDVAKKALLKKFLDHSKPLKKLAFSPDGKILISADDEGFLQIRDWQNEKVLKKLQSDNGINTPQKLEFSRNGKYLLLLINGSLGIFETKEWNILQTIKTKEGYKSVSGNMTTEYSSVPISSATFAENGAKIITTHDDETLRIWDTLSGKELKKVKVGESAPMLALIDGKNAIIPIGKWDKQKLKLIETETGKISRTFQEEDESKFEAIVVNPNGKNFLTGNSSGEILLWNPAKEKAVREFDIGYSDDDAIAFSPDGKTFAVGGENQNLFLFDVENGEKLWQLIPSYQPSDFEKELSAKAKALRNVINERLEVRKKQAEIYVSENKDKITAKFSHFGAAENYMNQRLFESGEANKSKIKLPRKKASVAWFALTNDANLPVSIDINSTIFNPNCRGLCNGAEISSRYGIELKDGKTRANGIDMYSKADLPPKTTVYFSVSLDDFSVSKAIYLDFRFQKDNPDEENSDDYGPEQRLYLRESDLSK